MKKIEITEFYKYYNTGLNDTEIAKKLGVSHSAIHYVRKKHNLKKNFKYTRTLSDSDYLKEYNLGLSDSQIAKKLNIKLAQVSYTRNKLKLPTNRNARFNFTDNQYQVIIGGLLGDSHLSKVHTNPYLSFAHSLAQEDYARWKKDILGVRFANRSNYCSNFDSRTKKTYYRFDVRTLCTSSLLPVYGLFYDQNKSKLVKRELLDQLTPLGLAVWFMDDGYGLKNGGLCLSTNSFSEEEKDIIILWFKETYNIKASKHKSGVLYLDVKSSSIFVNLVKIHIHSTLKYKIQTVLNKQEELLGTPILITLKGQSAAEVVK